MKPAELINEVEKMILFQLRYEHHFLFKDKTKAGGSLQIPVFVCGGASIASATRESVEILH